VPAGSASTKKLTPFVVGAVLPLSGSYAVVGDAEGPALQAIVRYDNLHGGVLGHQISVHIVNDASTVQGAIAATRKLVANYKMNLFFPDTITAETLASLPFAKGILSVDVCASTECGDGRMFPDSFSFNPPPQALFQAGAEYMAAKGYKTVGLIADQTSSGQTFVQYTTQYLTALGVKVVGPVYVPAGTTSVATQLSQLESAGADSVSSWASQFGINVLMNGMQSLGWSVPVVMPNGFNTGQPVSTLVPTSVASQVVCICDAVSIRTSSIIPAYLNKLFGIMTGYGAVTSLELTSLMIDEFTLGVYGYDKAGKLSDAAAAKAIESMNSDKKLSNSGIFFAYHGVNPGFTKYDHFPAVAPLLTGGYFKLGTVGPDVRGTYPGTNLVLKNS
jgi:hypothetical protein